MKLSDLPVTLEKNGATARLYIHADAIRYQFNGANGYVHNEVMTLGEAAIKLHTLKRDGFTVRQTVFNVEYTDTFGGDANYSWVRRATLTCPENISDAALMRRAKAAMGLTGVTGRSCQLGEMLEFRPYGSCTVLFVTPEY